MRYLAELHRLGKRLRVPHVSVFLLSLAVVRSPDGSEIVFRYQSSPDRQGGLEVPKLGESFGASSRVFDVWDEVYHPEANLRPVYGATPGDIQRIVLVYRDYQPIAPGDALAPLAFHIEFAVGDEVLAFDVEEPNPESSGSIDLLSTPIGPRLADFLGDYGFDAIREAAANPVKMMITASDPGRPRFSGSASFDIIIEVNDQQPFSRCDLDANRRHSITDVVRVLYQVIFPRLVSCEDAVDCNDDGSADIIDPIFLLRAIFHRGPAVSEPFPEPGLDPTPDDLGCQEF